MKKIFNILLIVLFSVVAFSSCKEQEVFTYDAKNALWFERDKYNNDIDKWMRMDTVEISATHYPGVDQYIHKFRIDLIGTPLQTTANYSLIPIDSLSQPEALKYIKVPTSFPFKPGVASDSLPVTIMVKDIPEKFRGYVTYKLVANENFAEGYAKNQTIKIWVNNDLTKPSWWNKKIEQAYLGVFTPTKLALFVERSGLVTLEGKSSYEMREICRDLKAWIAETGKTEPNGDPIVIPIY